MPGTLVLLILSLAPWWEGLSLYSGMEVSGYLGFLHGDWLPPKQTFQKEAFQERQMESTRPRMSLWLHSVRQAHIQEKGFKMMHLSVGHDMWSNRDRINDSHYFKKLQHLPSCSQIYDHPYAKHTNHLPTPSIVLSHHGTNSKSRPCYFNQVQV